VTGPGGPSLAWVVEDPSHQTGLCADQQLLGAPRRAASHVTRSAPTTNATPSSRPANCAMQLAWPSDGMSNTTNSNPPVSSWTSCGKAADP